MVFAAIPPRALLDESLAEKRLSFLFPLIATWVLKDYVHRYTSLALDLRDRTAALVH
jgi:hypothetical protein